MNSCEVEDAIERMAWATRLRKRKKSRILRGIGEERRGECGVV